ncbi:MAG: SDR family oxidoreductase [Hyphomonadaceae bacterium]
MKTVLIIGAAGDVGGGAAMELLAGGHRVIAAGRSETSLQALQQRAEGRLILVPGSVENEAAAQRLLADVRAKAQGPDVVISSINVMPARRPKTLAEISSDELMEAIRLNLATHFSAAKTFIPALGAGGLYIGIGGGMADFIFPHYGYNSMIQAALRMMFRYFDAESVTPGVTIKELIIAAMVTSERTPPQADAKYNYISDAEVGRHIRGMVEAPEAFEGAIQWLRSAKQVGQPFAQALTPAR